MKTLSLLLLFSQVISIPAWAMCEHGDYPDCLNQHDQGGQNQAHQTIPKASSTPSPLPPSRFDAGDLTQMECGNFCDLIAAEKPSDQWCANHGYESDPSVKPVAIKQTPSKATPATDPSAGCPNPMLPGDSSCEDVGRKLFRCKWKKGELESKCEVYRSLGEGRDKEGTAIKYDATAAAACGLECAVSGAFFGGMVSYGCEAAGAVATGFETYAAAHFRKKANLEEIMSMTSALAGGAGTAANISANVAARTGSDLPRAAGRLVGKDETKSTLKLGDSEQKEAKGQQHKAACATAAVFTVMTGVRAYERHQQGKGQQQACNDVRALYSKDSEISTQGITPPPLPSGSRVRMAGAPTYTNGGTTPGKAPTSDHGGLPPDVLAAQDGGILHDSGLDRALQPKVNENGDELLNQVDKNGAGAAIAGMMAGQGGDFGKGLADLASKSESAAAESATMPDLNEQHGTALAAAAGGGGGGGGAAEGDSLAKLFGNDKKGAGGAGALNFRTPASARDIWHTGTDQNIFEIVSSRYEKALLQSP